MNISHLSARLENALNDKSEIGSTVKWRGRDIVIYGAGNFGKQLASVLLDEKENVLGFLDQKGTGQVGHLGRKVHSLNSDAAAEWHKKNVVVLVGVYNPTMSIREVVLALRKAGFSEIVLPMEFYPALKSRLGSRYWLGTKQDYLSERDSIAAMYNLLRDDESRRIYLEILLYRLEADLDMTERRSTVEDQYAEPTLPRWKEPLHYVDGGAFTGDSLQILVNHKYKFGSIHTFEPDLKNFAALRQNVEKLNLKAPACLWPCGVFSTTTRLSFAEGNLGASALTTGGTIQVPVVGLDEALHDQPVNFIKLDIEGAEPQALEGAKKLLLQQKPGLAVCVYHEPRHLWSLGLWLNQLNVGYEFYLRTHAYNTFETVLYAYAK